MARIFISYRRTDSEGYAGRIWDRLTGKFGPLGVFMDVDSIEAGASFPSVLSKALSESVVLVAIIGNDWLGRKTDGTYRLHDEGDFVRQEIKQALDRKIVVIPVLVGGASVPLAEDLPADLRQIASLNAREIRHTRFDSDVAAVIDGIENAFRLIEAEQLQADSPPGNRMLHPTEETRSFLRRRLGEPRGMAKVLFGTRGAR